MSAQTSPVARRDSRTETNVVVWASISAIGVLLASVVLLIALSLLSWATDRPVGSTAGSASQVALQAWYLAHSVPLPVAWGSLSVPPLLVTGFIALLFYRSGRGAARACSLRTPAQIGEALAAIVITYITCAVLLSSIAYPSEPMLSIWSIVVGTGSLALFASLAGLLRESGLGARLIAGLPGPSYAYARGALAACWALAGMSAVAVGASLLINYSETSALTAALSPNGLGGLTIIGISIAYLPNAMLLATALGSGAGFDLGAGTLYSLGTVDREALPIFPLFAALPDEAGGLALLTVLVPLTSAVVGALTMTRHLEPEHRTATNLLTGSALCSVLTAVGVLGVGLYAAGGLGDGRLSAVGASPWRLALFLAVELAVAIAVTAFIATRRSLKPVSVARREKALSILETGGEASRSASDEDSDEPSSRSSGGEGAKGGGTRAKGRGTRAKRSGTKTKGMSARGSVSSAEDVSTGDDPETGGDSATDDATASGAAEVVSDRASRPAVGSDRASRPVIASKLAMRRLARGAKRTAKAHNAAAIKKQPSAAPKTAPAASLSVVKRAHAIQEAARSKPVTKPKASAAAKAGGKRRTKPAEPQLKVTDPEVAGAEVADPEVAKPEVAGAEVTTPDVAAPDDAQPEASAKPGSEPGTHADSGDTEGINRI